MFLNFAAYSYSNLKTMNPIIFTEFELQELEATKIIGGSGNALPIQNQCLNTAKGCGVGASQNQCENSSQCMCFITEIQSNCPNQTCK